MSNNIKKKKNASKANISRHLHSLSHISPGALKSTIKIHLLYASIPVYLRQAQRRSITGKCHFLVLSPSKSKAVYFLSISSFWTAIIKFSV